MAPVTVLNLCIRKVSTMNTVAQPTTGRQLNFVVALLAADVTPYMLGALDAERGELACPEMYFVKRGECCEYCEGYEAVAGATLTTRQFLGERSSDVTDAMIDAIFAPVVVDDSQLALDLLDYDAELEDYTDYLADVEFNRFGC